MVKKETEKGKIDLEESSTDKKDVEVELIVEAKSELYNVSVKQKLNRSKLPEEIDKIIEQISKSKNFRATPIKIESIITSNGDNIEDPVKLFATKIGVDPEQLSKSRLIAIKGDDVQILQPTKISARDGGIILLAINDYVFNQSSTPYKEWKEMCEGSNLKSNTPIYQIAGDIKRVKYIDKKKYDNTPKKEMKLTPKAVDLVKKVIEKFIEEN